jgi:DNA-binding transcriptional LysR family regulator
MKGQRMDLARLRTLQELAIRGTMAAVSEALRMSPSAVSQQIAQLEIEAGVKLVERRGRGVRLTGAGERLRQHADHIVAILEEARTDLAEQRKIVGGEVRIASFPSVGAALLPPVIRAVQAANPAVRITALELEPNEGLAAVRAWQADAAIIDDLTVSADVAAGSLISTPLLQDQLYAVLPEGHSLSRRRTVSLADLRNEAWAIDSSRLSFAESVIRLCEAQGFRPNINAQCSGFEMMAAMVESGCSVSVTPGIRLRSYRGKLVAKRLSPELRRAIFLVHRRGERRNPALNVVLRQFEETAAKIR